LYSIEGITRVTLEVFAAGDGIMFVGEEKCEEWQHCENQMSGLFSVVMIMDPTRPKLKIQRAKKMSTDTRKQPN
jgi:hypothetical protein